MVALATSCGALGSTQLRKKYAETSKTYFFSSSCCICVFQGFREEPLEEKKTSFFKVWSPSPSSSGSELRSITEKKLHVPQALDPETPRRTPPFLRRARRHRPPAGCSSNLWSSWVFKRKKAGKGNVEVDEVEVDEVEVSQMSRSRSRSANVRSAKAMRGRGQPSVKEEGTKRHIFSTIATLFACSYSYLLLPGDLRRRPPVPEEWRGIVQKRESRGRHVG